MSATDIPIPYMVKTRNRATSTFVEEWCDAVVKVCVHPQKICDHVEDCSNGEDEELCDIESCPDGRKRLLYSMTRYTNVPNKFPALPSEFM